MCEIVLCTLASAQATLGICTVGGCKIGSKIGGMDGWGGQIGQCNMTSGSRMEQGVHIISYVLSMAAACSGERMASQWLPISASRRV